MAIATIIFGVLLLILGVCGIECKFFSVDPAVHDWIVYPVIFGIVLAIAGFVERVKNAKLQNVMIYVNTGIGLVGLLLSALMALNGYGSARSEGVDVDNVLLEYRLAMSVILLVYMNVCIRTILNARAARKAAEEQD